MDRRDMTSDEALRECFDLWVSGAWRDNDAILNLEEVMLHIARKFNLPFD